MWNLVDYVAQMQLIKLQMRLKARPASYHILSWSTCASLLIQCSFIVWLQQHYIVQTLLFLNQSESEPFWFWTYLIRSLPDSKTLWFWTYLIWTNLNLKLSNSEPLWLWTFPIPNLSHSEFIWLLTNLTQNYLILNLSDFEPSDTGHIRYWTWGLFGADPSVFYPVSFFPFNPEMSGQPLLAHPVAKLARKQVNSCPLSPPSSQYCNCQPPIASPMVKLGTKQVDPSPLYLSQTHNDCQHFLVRSEWVLSG
jgi:hypothetical protein